MHQHRSRHSVVGLSQPPSHAHSNVSVLRSSTVDWATLEEATGSLDALEDNLRRNTFMSLHPSVRASRGGGGSGDALPTASLVPSSTNGPDAGSAAQCLTVTSPYQRQEDAKQRQQEILAQIRTAQAKRKRQLHQRAHPGSVPYDDTDVLSTFLAGGCGVAEDPALWDMPPEEQNTARDAAKEFEQMLLSNIVRREEASAFSSSRRTRHTTTAAAANSVGVPSSSEPLLKHPSCVPPSQYVKAQLDALRFSMERGFEYHNMFDHHVAHAHEARRVAQARQPARTECAVDFVHENRSQVQTQSSPHRMLLEANRERDLKAQRASASKEAMKEWFASQIERKRDIAEAAARRKAALRAQQQQQHGDDDEDGDMRKGGASASAVATNAAAGGLNAADSNPLALLSGLTTEREITGAVQSFWLVVIAAAARSSSFTTAAETIARKHREETEEGIRRRRLDTEHMNSLLALDTMKRKYDRCRTILKMFVQNRVRTKHSWAVDLILRCLRHRHRSKRTVYQVHWFRHSVIVCQRQVRVFLQSLAARRMLLHLQWIRKECALLQVPNGALACIHQQWSEQRKVVDTTQRMFAQAAMVSPLASGVNADAATAAGGSMASGKGTESTSAPLPHRGKANTSSSQNSKTSIMSSYPHKPHHHPSSSHKRNESGGDGFPLRRPGAGQYYVVWSTRVSWVPPGGIPLEYRNQQVHLACQSSLRNFVSLLLSADASRKFFVKQKARYDTDGLEALGLPKPKLPSPPIFQLFMPSTTLRLKVSLALKEKGMNKADESGGALKATRAGARSGGGTAETSPLKVTTTTSQGTVVGSLKATIVTTADDAPAAPAPSDLATSAADPVPKFPPSTKNGKSDEPQQSLLSRIRRKQLQQVQEVTPTSQTSLLSPSRLKHATSTSSNPHPPSPSSLGARKHSVTLLSPTTPHTVTQSGSVSGSPATNGSSPRRSVFEHFDTREDQHPVAVRTDVEYAQLLGRPTVAAMRTFIDTKNTLHLRPKSHEEDGARSALPRAQRVVADGPQLAMHLKSLSLHYEGEVQKRFDERYHHGPGSLRPPSPNGGPQARQRSPPKSDEAGSTVLVHHHVTPSPRRPHRAPLQSTASPAGPLLGEVALAAHKPAATGVITRRQHEERLRQSGPEEYAPDASAVLLYKPQPPIGSDPNRDVPKLLAFSGSSESQRHLMACGGARFGGASFYSSTNGMASSSSTARGRPVEMIPSAPNNLSVALLQEVIDAKAKTTARQRSKQFM